MVAPPVERRGRRAQTPSYPELGALIRARRELLERSQAFVSEKAGIDQSTLSIWEQGRIGDSAIGALRLIAYLGISRADLDAVFNKTA